MKSIPLWFLALLSLAVGTAYAQDPAEAAKIRQLIAAVETLEGAQFSGTGARTMPRRRRTTCVSSSRRRGTG